MPDTDQTKAVEHLRAAAALLDRQTPFLAVKVRRLAAQIATTAAAQDEYTRARASAGRDGA